MDPLALESTPPSSSSFSSFSFLSQWSWMTWVLLIFALAFVGINIFSYLAKGTQTIADVFAPIFGKVAKAGVATTGETINVAAEGAKTVINETADLTTKGLTTVQDLTHVNKTGTTGTNANLMTALDANASESNDFMAHQAPTSLQQHEAGWCFIGNDNQQRVCGQVGVQDTCMSGNIFPTQEICINPSLRA
jgi:hypothetical protein